KKVYFGQIFRAAECSKTFGKFKIVPIPDTNRADFLGNHERTSILVQIPFRYRRIELRCNDVKREPRIWPIYKQPVALYRDGPFAVVFWGVEQPIVDFAF